MASMRKMAFALFLFLIAATSAPRCLKAADTGPVFPLLGKWRVVGQTDAKGVFHRIKNGGSYAFYKSHSMVVIDAGDKEPAVARYWIFDIPGNIYLLKEYHGDSDHYCRVRFHVEGDMATIKSSALDAKTDPDDKPEGTLKLQRIK